MAVKLLRMIKTVGKNALVVTIVGLMAALPLQALMAERLLADTGTWLGGDLPQIEVGGPAASPTGNCTQTTFTYQSYTLPNGSFSPIPRDKIVPVCARATKNGWVGSTSGGTYSYDFVKPGTQHAYRVVNPQGQPSGIFPVPGQNTFFYSQSDGGSFGARSLRFYDNVATAGKFEPVYGSVNEMAFKLNAPLAEPLRDSADGIIHMMDGYGFSPNGEWMVIEAWGLGYMRINTRTRAMQLFDTQHYIYGQGWRPQVTLAINNDGNTVIRSGVDLGNSAVFDLSGCQPGPFSRGGANPTIGCRSRSLHESLQSQVSGFRGLSIMRFSADGKSVSGVVHHYDQNGISRASNMTYSVAGYQAPQLDYLALGDSFSSGEGAYSYEPGTDNHDPRNKCHLSTKSYPYLAAQATGASEFHNVACSGAQSGNYLTVQRNQAEISDTTLGNWQPGFRSQKEYLTSAKPNAVTISMIGNDIGFSDKLKRCIVGVDSCFHFKEERESIAHEIHGKFDTLVDLYKDIRSVSDARLYVMGYPQLFSTDNTCGWNVPVDQEERQMAQGLVGYLNAVIKAATEKAGVQYINVEQAFNGHQLCGEGSKAVNGLTAGNDAPLGDFGPLGNESFHPNALGHLLMSQALLAQSQNLTRSMPEAIGDKTAPFIGSGPYNNFIGNAPTGGTFTRAAYVGLENLELVYKLHPVNLNILDFSLKPNSPFEVWFNSEPTYAGNLTSNAFGELDGQITVPDSLEPGYHTMHIRGQNVAGEPIDLYKTLYVAASEDDIDGDGVTNTDEKCLIVEPSNIDHDRDGIDDACDGEITDPPADSVPPAVTGMPDRQPDSGDWYNHDVTISWNATDPAPSSGATTQPAPTIASQEGDHTYISEKSCDPLNNCATGSLGLKLDKTAPTLGTPAWTANPKATTGTTILTIPAADNLSGIAEAEYFLGDNDPGIGNGATMQLDEDVATTTFGADFPTGVYKVSARVKDHAGNWSLATSDYLVAYDPFGIRMTGRKNVLPSLENGDNLPGLAQDTQNTWAKFGFNVRYNSQGQIHPNSDLQLSYHTGAKFHNATKAHNCHRFDLNATSITWLTSQGTNNSEGIFQGAARLEVDGMTSTVAFRVIGIDGERLSSTAADHFTLLVFSQGDNPNTADPIYRVSAEVFRGNIRIRTQ